MTPKAAVPPVRTICEAGCVVIEGAYPGSVLSASETSADLIIRL